MTKSPALNRTKGWVIVVIAAVQRYRGDRCRRALALSFFIHLADIHSNILEGIRNDLIFSRQWEGFFVTVAEY
jgi:hypothetical protein